MDQKREDSVSQFIAWFQENSVQTGHYLFHYCDTYSPT